jgi:dihydrofolate synthase/folylpolyglutamate synthase
MDPLQYLFSLEQLGIKFGLDNIRRMLAALGAPQEAFATIHVAGTNGKGSVTAMVERALRAAGLRAARYTSPHLVRLEERFFIDGAPVETGAMRDAAAHVQQTVAALIRAGALEAQPTFFEATTAMAFELFRRRQVDVAVIEVGLGGRLDSTNVLTPAATAITSIDLDHQEFLGATLGDIALEKAGIIKPGVPVVVGELAPEAAAVVAQVARATGAPLVDATAGVQLRASCRADGRLVLDLTTPVRRYRPLTLALRGRHQARNAVTAVRLLEQLPRWTIPEQAIAVGLEDVQWPGRLDLVATAPDRTLLLDSAHNPAGAEALAAYLAECHEDRLPIVFAAMRDKDAERMLRALRGQARAFVLTAPGLHRAATAEDLLAVARRVTPEVPSEASASPADALERGWRHGPLVCATGSIFLVGEVLDLMARRTV